MRSAYTIPHFRLSFFFIILLLAFLTSGIAVANALTSTSSNQTTIKDPDLNVEVVFKGLRFPTSMAFLGPNDIIVLEKNNGTVQRIVNGTMLPKPLLDVNVATQGERGMLGIALGKHSDTNGTPTYVFLYFTETNTKDDHDTSNKRDVMENRLYRYELVNNKLINPKLLLDVPSPTQQHNGGKLIIGPDNNLYLVAGDGGRYWGNSTEAHNNRNGNYPDGTSAIYRITQDGNSVEPSVFGGKEPLNKYYAYGIRNSFGLDFDPVTGNLWDTENGPGFGDEINLVKPGFNSGWGKIQGIWKRSPLDASRVGEIASPNREGLVDFGGKGKYSDPEFVWKGPVGVTSPVFLNSDKLGEKYENDLFVADVNYGNIYHFDLNKKRNQLLLDDSLHDKIADNKKEAYDIILANGFGGVTDLEIGPDGYMYILTFHERTFKSYQDYPGNGAIYRIIPHIVNDISTSDK